MRILIVTDTHLSRESINAMTNWQAVRIFAGRSGVALTVHLGDITRDGWTAPGEHEFAASLAADWPTPLRFLPGNHDIGDNPPGPDVPCKQPLSLELLSHYRMHYGDDRWYETHVVGGETWWLLGINAQLFGTGTAAEAEQWTWLEEIMNRADSDPSVVFSHKPLFQDDISHEPPHIRYVPNEPRGRFRALLDRVNCRAFISGHTHQYREVIAGATRHIWAPSSSYQFPENMQETVGQKIVGVGVLELAEYTCRFDLVVPKGVRQHDFLPTPAASRQPGRVSVNISDTGGNHSG